MIRTLVLFLGGPEVVLNGPYAGNELVAVDDRSTQAQFHNYIVSDHQGSVAAIETGGNPASNDVSESFTAYGNRRSGETWSGAPSSSDETAIGIVTRRGYTGETTLGVSMGLNHLNGRIEDSITGRFLSPDPHIPDPTNTQSYNRYSYVNNNPLTMTDPTGFTAECSDVACTSAGIGGGGTPNIVVLPPSIIWLDISDLMNPSMPSMTEGGQSDFSNGPQFTWSAPSPNIENPNGMSGDDNHSTAQSQSGADSCAGCLSEQTVTARVYPALSDDYFVDPATWTGVSSWTRIGNIAHVALYLALLHRNPALAGRLLTNVAVDDGFLDLGLDGSLAYELKPDSWQYGGNYQAALNQIGGYTSGTGYTPGTWSALGTNSTWVGVSGTFSMYGINYTGGFSFYYDPSNSGSGLIFYQRFGSYNYDSSVPNGASNLTFVP